MVDAVVHAWTLPVTALVAFMAGVLVEWWIHRTIHQHPQRADPSDVKFWADAGTHYQPKHAAPRHSPHWPWSRP